MSPVNVRDAGEIERAIAAFARSSNGELIPTGSASSFVHGNLIITLAARHKLPAIYFDRLFVVGGGLASYGPDTVDLYRHADPTSTAGLKEISPRTLRCRRLPP